MYFNMKEGNESMTVVVQVLCNYTEVQAQM